MTLSPYRLTSGQRGSSRGRGGRGHTGMTGGGPAGPPVILPSGNRPALARQINAAVH